jgi:hypothetical protein
MSAGKTKDTEESTRRRSFKALAVFAPAVLARFFGSPTMRYDIDAYNRYAESAEEQMLLFNIGRLSRQRPPHFMMLQEVDQSRSFSADAALQWTHLWNSLFVIAGTGPSESGSASIRGSDTYQAGTFTAGTSESPLFKFIPIQGQEFANRFESPLTDKFTLFA